MGTDIEFTSADEQALSASAARPGGRQPGLSRGLSFVTGQVD
jgi:hypothetical protein